MKLKIMEYSDYRKIAETGDLVLCAGTGQISRQIINSAKRNKKPAIKLDAESVYYSHIGVIIVVYETVMIIEAIGEGFDLRRFSRGYENYNGKVHIYKSHIPLSNFQFAENLLNMEGRKYDYKSIYKQLINEIKCLAEKHKEDSALFCSEAVNLATKYFYGGEDVWVTPHDIALAEFKKNKEVIELKNVR